MTAVEVADGIRLENVTICFGRGTSQKTVLSDLSLNVSPGEFVCIVGPSGCGKSTLLKAIAGFVEPASGHITVNGRPVRRPDSDRGMVFQEYALFPWLTVRDNILFGNRVRRSPPAERDRTLEHYLSLVRLEGYGRYFPSQLSGGMKQRVALARAWANGPDVLLLDEPFGALDAMTRRELQGELLRIWQAERKTCVFVTHDAAEAAYLSDRVVVLAANPPRIARIVEIVLSRPRIRDSSEFAHTIHALEVGS